MNIILGSGLNALLARHILGSDYKIIKSGPSRFYSVNPASADNFIHSSTLLKPFEKQLGELGVDLSKHQYKCCWSVGGHLLGHFDKMHCAFWLSKIFGFKIPSHLELVYPNRMIFDVYGTRVNQLYVSLYNKYRTELDNAPKISDVKSIIDHQITFTNGNIIDYNKCVSTIPLDDLYDLLKYQFPLDGVDVSAILLKTTSLDFEGYNQLWVVDPQISFFKATKVSDDDYIFYFIGKINNPGLYLTPYINDFDLISGFYYKNYIPAGTTADTKWLLEHDIITLGMSAQWDAAMDISSCFHRLLKISDGGKVV